MKPAANLIRPRWAFCEGRINLEAYWQDASQNDKEYNGAGELLGRCPRSPACCGGKAINIIKQR